MEALDFEAIQYQANEFARFLSANKEQIAEKLSTYECYNVAIDEIDRSIDLLTNLEQNREYFKT